MQVKSDEFDLRTVSILTIIADDAYGGPRVLANLVVGAHTLRNILDIADEEVRC